MIEDFTIAMLAAPPGRIGLCRLPGRSGALAADVSAIVAWSPTIVVSLAEAAEMEALGAAGLPGRLEASGLRWRHFPIADFGAPEPAAEDRWRALADELHGALDAGRRVLIHCRGGLGRSGMVAARLIVERGADAAEAIARVRADRPGAVETEGQEVWVGRGAGLDPRPVSALQPCPDA